MRTFTFALQYLLVALLSISTCSKDSRSPLTIVILSQSSSYDERSALTLQQSLFKQALEIKQSIGVLVSGTDFESIPGSWAVWPFLKRLNKQFGESLPEWLFICEASTKINLSKLLDFLEKQDSNQKHFIGRALKDRKPVIIHHFFGFDQSPEDTFQYPDFAAGTALSKPLFLELVSALPNSDIKHFSIDPKHEFAMLVSSVGVSLVDNPRFCLLQEEENCITKYVQPDYEVCQEALTEDDVVFAVKTYSGYHTSRIVIIKRTWAKSAKHIYYFSEIDDPLVPTINLGINNTARGHCGKTFGIFTHFLNKKEFGKMRWLVIADDDTLLSVDRLYRLMSCYNPDQKLILGERYGYGFHFDGESGYDYPTGGSGMVFSRPAIEALVSRCSCPEIDSPDDMIIGLCAKQAGIPIIHSAGFHQAQPTDYCPLYLDRILPISFHKFENIDPYSVYVELLQDHRPFKPTAQLVHQEL